MDVIEVEGLRKIYTARLGRQRIAAVDGIDLAVRKGELFGLLGPNGAGKTTTVKMLLGLTLPTAGSARLLGRPVSDPESRPSRTLNTRTDPWALARASPKRSWS